MSEQPDVLRVQPRRGGGHAHDDHQQVGDTQVDDEAVRRVVHLGVAPHHRHDERVADDAGDEDDDVEDRHADEDVDGRLGQRRRHRRRHAGDDERRGAAG